MRLLDRLLAPPVVTGQSESGHASSEELAAYLSRTLSPADRASVEQHLARCDSCRRELASAQDLLSRRKRPMQMGGLALVAVAVTLVVLLRAPASRPAGENVPLTRGAAAASTVNILEPAREATVSGRPIAFAWSSVPDALRYRLTLLTEAGDQLWSSETTATRLLLPDSIRLSANASYLWYVDAVKSDGDSVSSGPTPFRTR